jgi:L-lactate dehydrogenase complex protein LldG
MTTARESFLQRVRQAVAEGNRAGAAPAVPSRGGVGYQGAGTDLVLRFCAELTAAGGEPHVVADAEAAAACVLQLVQAKTAKRVLLGRGPALDRLQLPDLLRQRGVDVALVDTVAAEQQSEVFFQADVGVSGALHAVAETGTLVMASHPQDPRSLSLLPPMHIAVIGRGQLLADLFDLFAELEVDKANLPACLALITGPSKTGDIELTLVTGVHGPGELHVIVVAS